MSNTVTLRDGLRVTFPESKVNVAIEQWIPLDPAEPNVDRPNYGYWGFMALTKTEAIDLADEILEAFDVG